MNTKTKNSFTNEDIRNLLNNSANKTNNNLIFFFSFGLYVFISVINTSDIALLLPRHSFKMPFIDFELGLLHFYVLAPLLLLLLHFNLLFNHYKNLEKLDEYKKRIDLNTINPSLYGFAFIKGTHGWEGFMINSVLYLLLYILPIIVFTTMYIRFSDYHHFLITPFHLLILIIDIVFILSSILHVHEFRPQKMKSSFLLFILIGSMMIGYFYSYYAPIVYKDYDPLYKETSKNKYSCKLINIFSSKDKDIVCYPRLVVTEEEMAIISKSALYIPRYLTMKNIDEKDKEHDLIINHGTRIDLSYRNLRYAILKGNILTRANLMHSDLQASNLISAHMQATDLYKAKLSDALMIGVKLESANLASANLMNAYLVKAEMQKIFVNERTNFSGAQMQDVNLSWGDTVDTNKMNFQNVNLKYADLTGTNFFNVNFSGSSFYRANLTATNFSDANLTSTDFSNTSFSFKKCEQLKGAPQINPKIDCGIPGFRNAVMQNANFFQSKIIDYKILSTKQQENIICVDINRTRYYTSNKIKDYLLKETTKKCKKPLKNENISQD